MNLLASLALGDGVLRLAAHFLRLDPLHDALAALLDAYLALLLQRRLRRGILVKRHALSQPRMGK